MSEEGLNPVAGARWICALQVVKCLSDMVADNDSNRLTFAFRMTVDIGAFPLQSPLTYPPVPRIESSVGAAPRTGTGTEVAANLVGFVE